MASWALALFYVSLLFWDQQASPGNILTAMAEVQRSKSEAGDNLMGPCYQGWMAPKQ